MNQVIDVNATFNPAGEMKPLYLRIEDEQHELHTYRIEEVVNRKEERYCGIHSILFTCRIKREECLREIQIRYYIETHKWAAVL